MNTKWVVGYYAGADIKAVVYALQAQGFQVESVLEDYCLITGFADEDFDTVAPTVPGVQEIGRTLYLGSITRPPKNLGTR